MGCMGGVLGAIFIKLTTMLTQLRQKLKLNQSRLRRFFEVDWQHIAWTAGYELFKCGSLSKEELEGWREELGIDASKPDPLYS